MQQNRPLAMEMLGKEVRRTRFWRTAFIMTFAVAIIGRIIRKDGAEE